MEGGGDGLRAWRSVSVDVVGPEDGGPRARRTRWPRRGSRRGGWPGGAGESSPAPRVTNDFPARADEHGEAEGDELAEAARRSLEGLARAS